MGPTSISGLWMRCTKKGHDVTSVIFPAKITQPEPNCEETSEKIIVKDILQYNQAALFNNVNHERLKRG